MAMDESNEGDRPSIDLQRDNINDTERQVDASVYTLAGVFGAVALPPGMPDYLKAAIDDKVEAARRVAQESGFVIADNADLIGGKTREERRREADDETADALRSASATERQREDWERKVHDLAGQHLTGAEWADMARELQPGEKGHNWLVDYLVAQGKTKEEAEKTASDMQLAASGTSKPEADRTREENEAITRVNSNPESATILKHYQQAREEGFPPVAQSTTGFTNTSQKASVDAGAAALDAMFPSAPDLTEHHRAAVAATQPLDQPPSPPLPPTPKPTAVAGLDL